MPEVKNTFIQSKMNKDMDGRILPNGQYRDGQNVQISRSEGDDVGALETVLGNDFKTNFGLDDDNLVAIGKLRDDTGDAIYLFLTNYTDCSYDQLSNPTYKVSGVSCYIVKYDLRSNLGTILVEGNFLNFSTTHLITGVNLLEDLLFWTDNRNQPRKINITLATPGHYTNEDQISVSKYYPYEAISLLKENTQSISPALQPPFESTMLDTTSEYLPIHTAAKISELNAPNANDIKVFGCYDNIKPNTPGFIGNDGNLMTGAAVNTTPVIVDNVQVDYGTSTTVISIVTPDNPTAVPNVISNLEIGDILYFQFLNPDYLPAWPGDPDYLKNRFVRFSYRFKFEDNEYSLAAPFTQIAFVPRQDGYFIGDNAVTNGVNDRTGVANDVVPGLVGQESATFDTTVVDFMQNKITDITLRLLAPTHRNLVNATQYSGSAKQPDYMNWSEVESKLKIKEIEILYKEADSNKITVLDTLTLNDFSSINSKNLYYNYQSRKPWKTVVPNQTTWVSSQVPVKALAQEVSGNRVMYGNFIDKHSTPLNLNYTLQIGDKPEIPDVDPGNPPPSNLFSSVANVRKEYQNHTLKQNRTYQVGVVLSDRYGRSSNVILSSVQVDNQDPEAKGSTIFHTYKNPEDQIIQDKYSVRYVALQDPTTWPGDMLNITFENAIPQAKNNTGYPGVYSKDDGSIDSVIIQITNPTPPFNPALAGCTFTVDIANSSGGTGTIGIEVGPGGEAIFTGVGDPGSGWTNGANFTVIGWPAFFPGCAPSPVPSIQGIVLTPKENPLGWYSYKIVVKQQQQEYYNVYLPGSMAGYPCFQNPSNTAPFNISTLVNVDPAEPSSDSTSVDQEYGAIPQMIYPTGQSKSTSHIVLFSDNINKVPRDLQELGPLQDEFRSGEEVFIRVESILLDGGATFDDTYSSRQYEPNVLGDKVIAIASMEKLGLGDLTTSPAFPIIPNLFYKGDTNPLIARIETENMFGIRKGDGGNLCEAEYFRPADAPADSEVVRNTRYSYGPTLAVLETKPVESLLDIFWETTTSGLIQQLNYDIENSDNTIPSGLTQVDITWSEADDYGDVISNDFQAAGPTGNPLGAGVEVELINVVDGNGTSYFGAFDLNSVGVGEYNISIAPCNTGGCPGFLCWEDPAKNIFFFTFALTDLSTGLISNVEATGYVFNREPIDRGALDVNGGALSTNLKSWLKEVNCDGSNNLGYDDGVNPINNPRDAVFTTLRAEQGGQKFGLSSVIRRTFSWPGENLTDEKRFLDQFIVKESLIPNAPLNFGKIKPDSNKYVFWDRQLDPGYPLGETEDTLKGCGGDVEEASPKNRCGGASGFRSFGYFGLRNYYEGYPPYSPTANKPDGWPSDQTALFDLSSTPSDADNFLLCGDGRNKQTVQLQYLYDVEQWEDTQSANFPDAAPPYNSIPYPNIHDGVKVSAPLYMGKDEGPNADNVKIHPSCGLTKFNSAYDWDGEFRVANGAWGSDQPTETFPIGGNTAGTFGEIEWSIPRMYQVSMMIPFGEEQEDLIGDFNVLGDIFTPTGRFPNVDEPTEVGTMGNYGCGGLSGNNPDCYMDYQPAGEVVFGLYQTFKGTPPATGKNSILNYIPSGPIYWENKSSQLNDSPAIGGESIVGLKYNQRNGIVDPLEIFPYHYWPDLNKLLTQSTKQQIVDFRGNPLDPANTPAFMKLQNGANTFYQWNSEHATWKYERYPGYDQTSPVTPENPSENKNFGEGHWEINEDKAIGPAEEKNILNYLFYLGGIDPTTKLGNINNLQRFFMNPIANTGQGYNQVAKAFLSAGFVQDPNNFPQQPWSGPHEYGNGMPGGRYIVVVRATDKNGAADGMYYEFEVPVYLPWWSTRTNCPLLSNL